MRGRPPSGGEADRVLGHHDGGRRAMRGRPPRRCRVASRAYWRVAVIEYVMVQGSVAYAPPALAS